MGKIREQQKIVFRLFIVFVVFIFSFDVGAKIKRRSSSLTQFQRLSPCPSTGQISGPCPGWVKDHIVPLCAGGADSVENLQWQTIQDAKPKDDEEKRFCAKKRSGLIND